MDRNSFVEKIKVEFQWLLDLGYEFKCIETSIYFEKNQKNEAFALSFSWTEYNRFLIHGITAYKRFNEVEKKITQINGTLDYTIKTMWKGDIPSEFEATKNENHLENSFFIEKTSQIDLFAKMVKLFFFNEVEQFYEKYEGLINVINEMVLLSSDKKAS